MKRSIILSLTGFLLTAVYLTVTICLFTATSASDESGLTLLASGKLNGSNSPYFPFSNILFGLAAAGLYRIFPQLNGYMITLILIYGICMAAFLRTCARLSAEKARYGTALAAMVIGFVFFHTMFFCFLTEVRYTYIAGLAAVTFLWCTFAQDEETRTVADKLISGILLVFGICLRTMMFHMAVPFIALLSLWKVHTADALKRHGKEILAWLLLIIGLFMLDKIAWSGERADNKQMDEYRAQIQDYGGMPEYSEYKKLFVSLGITRAEHRIMGKSCWGLMEHFTPEVMSSVAETRNHATAENIRTAAENLFSAQSQIHYSIKVIIALLLLLNLFLQFHDRNRWGLIILLLLTACWLGECFYLEWKGRTIFRAVYPLDLTYLVSLLILLSRRLSGQADRLAVFRRRVVPVLLILVILFAGICTTAENSAAIDELRKADEIWEPVYAYAAEHRDQLFLCCPTPTASFDLANSLPDNLIKLGGWISITPEWQERICGEYEDACTALVERRNEIRFVVEQRHSIYYVLKWINQCLEAKGSELRIASEIETMIGPEDTAHGIFVLVPKES